MTNLLQQTERCEQVYNNRQGKWAVKATVVAVATALALTACSGGGGSNSADGGGDQVTLRFAWWGSDLRHEATQEAIDAFETENPNITVEGEFGEWSGYWDKLATMTAGGDAPDVIQMSDAYMSEYAGRGALLDLSKQTELETSTLDASSLQSGEINGILYAVEAGANAPVVFANAKLFEAAGVEMPDDKTWTWDDYTEIAQAITKASPEGTYGADSMMGDPILNAWLRQRGASMFTSDGEVGFDAMDLASFFTEVKEQSDDEATPQASVIAEQSGAATDQTGLGTNRAAMSFQWSNLLPAVEAASGSEMTVLRVPSMTGDVADNGMYLRGSQYYSASSQTEHPAEAAKFIDFLVNDTKAGDILLAERGIPINPTIRDRIEDAVSPADAKILRFVSDIAPELEAAPALSPVGGGTYDEISNRYVTEVLFETKTPMEAAEGAVNELKAAVAAAR